jgi:hypothetical protein
LKVGGVQRKKRKKKKCFVSWKAYDELMHLGCHMQAKVIGLLKPFLAFTSSFQPCATHNMLVFMFDSWFKNLHFIHDFVGIQLAMQVAI